MSKFPVIFDPRKNDRDLDVFLVFKKTYRGCGIGQLVWGRTSDNLIAIWPASSFPWFQECAGGGPPGMLTPPVEAYVPRSSLEAGEPQLRYA